MKRTPPASRPDPDKPFHIQRKRLGVVKFMRPEGDFGFIDAEDFREDVFFHKSAWQDDRGGLSRPPEAGNYVEFELDDDYFSREKKLRAKAVRFTDRPMSKRLSFRDTPHLANPHHPKARRKRPTWRGGSTPPPAADPGPET